MSRSQPIVISDDEMDENEFDDFDDFDDEESLGSLNSMNSMDDGDDVDMDDIEEIDEMDDDLNDDSVTKHKELYKVPFKVMSVTDLSSQQQELTNRVSNLLGLNVSDTNTLLRYFKYHQDLLIERFMEDSNKVMKSAGVFQGDFDKRIYNKPVKAEPGFMCFICCNEADDDDDDDLFMSLSLPCDHRICLDCYKYYVGSKIRQEGEVKLKCPGEKCGLVINDDIIKQLVDSETYKRYLELINESFVDSNQYLSWCPAPNCQHAVECKVNKQDDLKVLVPSVECQCGHSFCFGCNEVNHEPCICVLATKWIKKCQDDSETSNWIHANTKDCPKCHSCIEKNGGCNHMTCKKCRHEFCWMCMGDWSKHGTAYYNCSRFNDEDSQKARNEQERSRAELERYLHYYNRYQNHEQSLKLDGETFIKIENKMKELQENQGMSWIEVQFLNQAFQVLKISRKTLTWTYVFAYYLKKNHLTQIFEDNQRDLELAVEQLSELFETPSSDLANQKIQFLDKCAYVSNRRIVLLNDVAQGLKNQTWKFNVDLN